MPLGGVKYPAELRDIHVGWLTAIETLLDTFHTNTAWQYSPFEYERTFVGGVGGWNVATYALDASADIAQMQARVALFNGLVQDIDAQTQWKANFKEAAKAVSEVDTTTDSARTLLSLEEKNLRRGFLAKLRTWLGAMAEIGAVRTSSFVIGRALLEEEFQSDFAKANAEVFETASNERLKSVLGAVETMDKMVFLKMALQEDAAALYSDMKRIQVMAEWEATDREMAINLKECLWDFSLYQHAANMMASLHGTVVTRGPKPPKQCAWGSVVGGLLVGIGGLGGYLATA